MSKKKGARVASPLQQPIGFSKEDLIQINEEAFYRALKRMQDEKELDEKEKPLPIKLSIEKFIWGFFSLLKNLFIPFRPKNMDADDLLRTSIGTFLLMIWVPLFVFGVLVSILIIVNFFVRILPSHYCFAFALFAFYALLFSMLVRASYYDISYKMPSNQLYAYTASLTASASMFATIIALFIKS